MALSCVLHLQCYIGQNNNGDWIAANLAESLPCNKQRAEGKNLSYVRMEILLGGTIGRPVEGGKKTECMYFDSMHDRLYALCLESHIFDALTRQLRCTLTFQYTSHYPVDENSRSCVAP